MTIKLSTGKEIDLTADELGELLGKSTVVILQPAPVQTPFYPYYPSWPNNPWLSRSGGTSGKLWDGVSFTTGATAYLN